MQALWSFGIQVFEVFDRRAIQSVLLLVSLGVLWGSGYALARYAMTHGVAPLGYAFWQTLGPAVLLAVIGYRRVIADLRHFSAWRFFVVTGLLGIAVPNTTMYVVSAHLPAGLLAVIVNTAPLLTYGMAWVCSDEPFHPLRISAVVLCVIGLMVLVFVSQSFDVSQVTSIRWVLLSLLSPLCFAAIAVYTSRRRPVYLSSITLAVGMLLAAFVFLLPVTLSLHAFHPITWHWQRVDQVIVLEILLSSLGYVVFFRLIQLSGSVYYSLVAGVVAVTGLFWGWLLFQEQFTLVQWSAVGLILISIALVTQRFRRS